MKNASSRSALALVAIMALALARPARAQSEGLFADFTTTSGAFTCRLEYAKAPRTVANFIRLATGTHPWLDVATGLPRRKPFYDGLTFHRVIPGFMIQGGSPNGQGTDGPGYAFPDEFEPTLRHDAPGVLSMANSGKNSNGAQFFITVAPTAWLDNVHSVFGRVVAGQEIVTQISQAPRDSNDRPLTPVVVQKVTIRRAGAAAEAFDAGAQDLPEVSSVRLGMTGPAASLSLSFTRPAFAQHRLNTSSNLLAWTTQDLGIEPATPLPGGLVLDGRGHPRQFFSLVRVQYSSSTHAPRTPAQRNLTLVFSGGLGTLAIQFDASGGGSYTFNSGTPGTVTGYTWVQEPYRGLLQPIYFSTLVPMVLKLDFAHADSGTFSGTAYTTVPFSVSGTFTLN